MRRVDYRDGEAPNPQATGTELALYDTARRALAKAVRVDEAKAIRNKAVAMEVYARQAKDRTLIENATEIRMRAERRAGELLRELEKNQGAVPGKTGRKGKPVLDGRPKLADLGVTKTQSSRWQRFAALDPAAFEQRVVTRANVETVLLAKRGSPRRLAADVHQVVIAPVGEHSAKPDEVYRRIERLYPGPYLELFARKSRPRWTVWKNEIQSNATVAPPRPSVTPVTR
jgi:MT-A70